MRASTGFLMRLFPWVVATLQWLPELIVFFAPILVALVICVTMLILVPNFWPCSVERAIRYIGGILQLFGVITIVIKLRIAQRQFPQQKLKRILERRPRLTARTVRANFTATLTSTGTVRAEVRRAPTPPPSLEQQIAALEERYTKLRGEVGDLGKELRAKNDDLCAKLDAEATARDAADKRIGEQMTETAVGSFHLDLWGVVFVLLGIVAGTLSHEIAGWLGSNCA